MTFTQTRSCGICQRPGWPGPKKLKSQIRSRAVSKSSIWPKHSISGKQFQKGQIWVIWPLKRPTGNPVRDLLLLFPHTFVGIVEI